MSEADDNRVIWEGIRQKLVTAIECGKKWENELQDLQNRIDTNRARVENLRMQDEFWSAEIEVPAYSEVGVATTSLSTPSDKATPSLSEADEDFEDGQIHRPKLSHADMAKLILKDTGKDGMTIDEFVEEMKKRNHPLPEDPKTQRTTVYSGLWRRTKEFFKDGDVWMLRPGV